MDNIINDFQSFSVEHGHSAIYTQMNKAYSKTLQIQTPGGLAVFCVFPNHREQLTLGSTKPKSTTLFNTLSILKDAKHIGNTA